MATKKVEEKEVKNKKTEKVVSPKKKAKVSDLDKKDKKIDKKVVTKKKDIVKKSKVEEEKVICEECGKKYLSSLKECPKCGFSPVNDVKTKSFYDEYDEDFEDYDDEDEEFVSTKEKKEILKDVDKKISSKKELEKKIEEEKKSFKEENKKEQTNKANKKDKKEKINKETKKVKITGNRSAWLEQNKDVVSFIKILVVIVFLVLIVYLVAAFLNKEFENDGKDDTNIDDVVNSTIQNDKILASSIFDKSDKEYYVLAYDGSDDWADYYALIYQKYNSVMSEDILPIYWVDLSDSLNQDVVAKSDEDVNKKAKKYADLGMKSPTLIHIKKGKNIGYYDGDNVVKEITKIIKSFEENE